MKKFKLLSLFTILGLCSCSGSVNYLGTYSFMLGKLNESHVRIAFDLTNEDYYIEEKEEQVLKGKKFKASLDTGEDFELDIRSLGIDTSSGINIEKTNKELSVLISDLLRNLEGYYNIEKEEKYDTTYGKRLHFGTSINNSETLSSLDIPSTLIEYIVVAYINSKSLTLQLPVSFDDLIYQLCWYGYYINTNSVEHFITILSQEDLPGEKDMKKRFGTHPSVIYDEDGQIKEDEVVSMNTTFCSEFSNTYLYRKVTSESGTALDEIGKIVETAEVKIDQKTGEEVIKYDYTLFNTTSKESKWEPSSGDFTAVIKCQNDYGVYDVEKDVSVGIKLSDYKQFGHATIYKFDDASGKEYDRSAYVQEPFSFRDFHDIRIGLARE